MQNITTTSALFREFDEAFSDLEYRTPTGRLAEQLNAAREAALDMGLYTEARIRGSKLAEIIPLVEGQNQGEQFMRIIRAHIDDEHWAEEEVKLMRANDEVGFEAGP